MCVGIPFILDVRLLVDAPAGVTQDLSTFLLRYMYVLWMYGYNL